MNCIFCKNCRELLKDPANQHIVSALLGIDAEFGPDVWEREPDLQRLRHAFDALPTEPLHAIAEFEALADAGSQASMVYLGHAYEAGKWVAKDLPLAASWFRRAGQIGLRRLGEALKDMADFAGARDAYERALDGGDRLSIYYLARNCMNAPPPYRDLARARTLLEQASADGNVFASRDLGNLLIRGRFGLWNRFRGILVHARGIRRTIAVMSKLDANPPDKREETVNLVPVPAPARA